MKQLHEGVVGHCSIKTVARPSFRSRHSYEGIANTFVQSTRPHASGFMHESFERSDIHIHVPAGATPKDGPSAGVAMFVALVSLLTDRPVRSSVAMTGEISLRGLELPIGGVKEKVLAALRAGITTVMLPARNERDLEDIPADARARLEFVWLDQVDDAIRVAVPDASAAHAKAEDEAIVP